MGEAKKKNEQLFATIRDECAIRLGDRHPQPFAR